MLSDAIVHESEFGDPNTILFQTFDKDWSRYDDIIDYIEAKLNPKTEVIKLDSGIYPYETWWNVHTGETYREVDGIKFSYLQVKQHLNDMGMQGSEFIKNMGFENDADALENCVPKPPIIILEYFRYLNLFKNPEEVFKQLRPIIYTYWA